MKLFRCQVCGQIVHFENCRCERCGHRLGYLPEAGAISALAPEGSGWRALQAPSGLFRFCANARYDACNWLVDAASADALCRACRHNGTIPDLTIAANLQAWRLLEFAKRRLFYTLIRLGLPLLTRSENPEHGLVFEFLADPPAESGPKVMTGHDNGRITIALIEADDSEREKRRNAMGEPYRTLIGHFRHEIGHHYWDVLVRDGGRASACRALFGDDREDYGAALQRHHKDGPPSDWQERFVTAYATAHPWEDFAETWAHYLHIVDTSEMAASWGLLLAPGLDDSGALHASFEADPYGGEPFDELIRRWIPLTSALNSINRCMGQPDIYPFIITPPVVEKLAFIHELVRNANSA